MVSQSRSVLQPLRRWDPERIGPYAIIGKLGAGAMGQVFLARSVAGRLVAVKTIRVEMAEEPGFRARFAREVAAARRVSGVFTASVIEADADADLPWVATAYVPAPSLSTLVRQCGPLPIPAVRWLAAGCAEALQSIHGVGLLHRDVKPSNVLVAPDGPRVIDFGVARAAERIELTATRGAAGTPAYMAPEQARDATRASPASDVFSLGATLVFAATGHPPYQGETVMDVLVRLANEPPDLTGVPAELTDLVAACLERVPRDRPTDTAILAGLGPFATLSSGDHSYLPDSALALISEYQHDAYGLGQASAGQGSPGQGSTGQSPLARNPQAGQDPAGVSGPGDADARDRSDDEPASWRTDGSNARMDDGPDGATGATSGSHTALPGFESPAAFHAGQERPPSRGRGHGRLAARTRWAWLVVAAAAAALVAAGAAIGIVLDGRASPPPGVGPPPSAQSLGPFAAPDSECTSSQPSSTPLLCVNQPTGDSDTVFVLHGSGFPTGTQITVSVLGHGASPYRPPTDRRGTFSYAIDQGYDFFSGRSGAIPPGTYTAVATASDGTSARTTFQVVPPGSAPPPGSGPPPGAAAAPASLTDPESTTSPPAASTTPGQLAAPGRRRRRRRGQ
jgi:serine/threonine protein kinase